MKKTTIKIGGIHCASCSAIIEKGTKKLTGIESVAVNLATNNASIQYDESKVNLDAVIQKITSLGYTVTEENNTDESQSYLKRFVLSTICTLPIATMMFVNRGAILGDTLIYLQTIFIVLTFINVMVLGAGFHTRFIKKARQGQTNMDTLISIGTLIALIYSIYAYVMTYIYQTPTDMGHFIMGANFIITFILLGKYFETTTKGQASQAIQKLLQLQAKDAIILVDGKETKVSVDSIKIGDTVLVRAGDKIPVDGDIIKGDSDIDEAMLTGESVPVHKKVDDDVYTGTLVINGTLHIQVTKESSQTMLAKIIDTVNDAQASKPPIQHLVDKISSYFVRVILFIAILTLLIRQWKNGIRSESILHMISVIVIACPCAMGLATPVAIMVASGKGASEGVLIKSGEILEKSQQIDVVIFDKTGTLTQGKPTVTDIIEIEGDTSKILNYASALGQLSNHPLSQSIVLHAGKTKKIEVLKFKELSGRGLKGSILNKKDNKKTILMGNHKLLTEHDIDIDKKTLKRVEALQEEGKTVNYLTRDNKILGLIGLLDTPKSDAKETVEGLKKIDIQVVMISGDNKRTVQAIAKQIGIQEFHAGVLPEQKADIVKSLQGEGKVVAFVGDGINDAPALAQADLAIGIGQGSDIAIEAADIILVQGNPSKVLNSIKLSRKTYAIIKQNLFWAFAYNAILVPVAAFGLLVPMYASLAMSLSSVSVVINSLRIKR